MAAATAPAKGHSPTVVHLAWSKYKQQLAKKPLQTKVQLSHLLELLLLLLFSPPPVSCVDLVCILTCRLL
jgi:hypothetical protein